MDENTPIFGRPRLTVVYFQTFQDDVIPLFDGLLISPWVLATFVPAIGTHLAELVNSFDDFDDNLLLSFDNILYLL